MLKFLLCFLPLAFSLPVWVVKLENDSQQAREAFQLEHNLEYVGDMPHLKGYYAFRATDKTNQNFLSLLADPSSGVTFMEQQQDRKRYKRTLDPLWSKDWHLQGGPAGVQAEQAWALPYGKRGSASITVAIVDDGLQSGHPDQLRRG